MHRLVLALALACSTLSVPAVADACGNSVLAGLYRRIQRAEAALDAGKYQQAARLARAELAKQEDARAGDQQLEHRARRVLALAVVRGRGPIRVHEGIGDVHQDQQTAAISWAITALRQVRAFAVSQHVDCALDPALCSDDLVPRANAELAEAYARSPDLRGEALAILTRIAEADLMPGPDAWAALARLRGEQGDAAGRALAVQRCRQMAAQVARCGEL
ncbi:hypothetical protein [Nannocystis punicea]|uniref:Lysozyme inhibitor LprI N-terminal domain-containing protein n=1 Tax=Nannocystis punicea TaxID=2995304 RepID=A0ABY7HCU3_9BACT|nr:hypothetical protein [Nannocystis poenicansa]WAS97103.1 hypothetical protein O0S08_13225 [Nannocystis poenicansa]